MSFPSTLTGAIDGVTEIEAAHLNNLEAKVGVDNSIDPNSLDYKLRNPSSSDPGHKHTAGAFTGGFDGDVFFRDPADHLWKPVGPDNANLVAKTGAQTIAGVKTFSSIPLLPASDPIAGNEATRKTYVDAQVALKVAKAGDTMTGNLAMGGNDITGVGTLVAANAQLTNPLPSIYGGTGFQSFTPGDILYASHSNALATLHMVAAGSVLLSGTGLGDPPGMPGWGKVGLTTHVSGILGSANGGTGNGFAKFSGPATAEKTFTLPDASATILTTNAAVTAAQGGTGQSSYAVGDLLFASAANALSKLADVAAGQVLVSGGVGAAPAWSNAPVLSGDLSFGANDGVRVFGIQRRTVAGQPGYQLTVKASGSTDGSTDQDGGTLVLRGGQSTGAGLSRVQIQTSPAGAAGSARRSPVTIIDIEGNKMAFFGASPVVQPALLSDPAADTAALATWAASINDYLINLGFMASA